MGPFRKAKTLLHHLNLSDNSFIHYHHCFHSFCGKSADTRWMKVNLLLEFGEWLYSHNYPRAEAQQQVQWAVDILLHVESEQADGAGKNPSPPSHYFYITVVCLVRFFIWTILVQQNVEHCAKL